MDDAALLHLCDDFARRHGGTTPHTALLGAQFDAGLAHVHHPEGHGGLGLSPLQHRLAGERLLALGVEPPPFRSIIGRAMGAPTIVAFGDEEQRSRWLRPLFTGEELWCQLFSEPGAGSDLAALATRAVREGDEWVVNGQKVWTSLASEARWGLLVARTDPEAPKHGGLTYFVIDMHQPGVDIRPLRQITGDAEFSEVYLDDARVPDAFRLGAVGDGWKVALTTLSNERVTIGGGVPERDGGPIGDALRLWREGGHDDPVLRRRLVDLWSRAEALRLTNIRGQQAAGAGTPGPQSSVGKIITAELNQQILDLCLDLRGPDSLVYGSYEGGGGDPLSRAYLRAKANSIEGGTSEVLRNIVGERVLGLPGEPRTDKGIPWSQVPRS